MAAGTVLTIEDIDKIVCRSAIEYNNENRFIRDDIVYWQSLANKFDVPYENLPDPENVTQIVKKYLAIEVSIAVARSMVDSNLEQSFNQTQASNEWVTRVNYWTQERDDILNMISKEDVCDPENPPIPNDPASRFVTHWKRG